MKIAEGIRWYDDAQDDVFKKFSFRDRWCGWIQDCLRSSWGSVIVNGSPTEEFQFFKGLNRAILYLIFLFILIMESLHISFQRVVDAGLFKGIVDLNIDTIVHVLECFHRASGLRINMRSKVGRLMSRIQSWNEIVDNMAMRLSKWKMNTLSITERLTLLKSVLGSISIYHMSIFKVPMKVLHRMESIRSHFFNGTDLGSKKSIWMKWNNVLASKEKGGLGVSSLYALNRALVFKWIWRFTTHKSSLWARVIKAIHGDDGKIGRNSKSGHTSIWRDIVREIEVFKKQGMDIASVFCPICGNAVESSRHLFFDFHVAKDLFRKISRWWDLSYMEVSSYDEWLAWILNLRLSVKHKRQLEAEWIDKYAMLLSFVVPNLDSNHDVPVWIDNDGNEDEIKARIKSKLTTQD
nr:RNA-directed DNA polymerase, eukaryota, reverse transcriptase zinc-binding domain protein [Tanacetum cinerariifolium]